MDRYSCFSELAASEARRADYEICVRRQVASQVAVIAPHGGGIEPETSRIAESIAGAEFSLYCFLGLKRVGNQALHITSHNFDEPECLGLIAEHDWVLAIHGCEEPGERAFLGGLSIVRPRSLLAKLSPFSFGLPTGVARSGANVSFMATISEGTKAWRRAFSANSPR